MALSYFENRRQCKERVHLREMVDHCWKRLERDRDILPARTMEKFRCSVQAAQNAATAGAGDIGGVSEKLTAEYERCFPRRGNDWLRENGEVLLVAVVVAMLGIKPYILQPFKIPTGSMQPTLNGITVRAAKPNDVQWWYRLAARPILGETVLDYTTETGGSLYVRRTVRFGLLHNGGRNGFFNWLPAEGTEFEVGNAKYVFPGSPDKLQEALNVTGRPPGGMYKPGDTVLKCVVRAGDHLFVDRLTYNFRRPERGDIFVFETKGIPVASPGDFYIKRLAGLPGDTLQIRDGDLFLDGKLAAEPGFKNVMSRQNGYRGYATGQKFLSDSNATFTLQSGQYFALGDNSYHSADSRSWGVVPYKNIIGRGYFVYWPFSRHFGRVE